MLLSRFTKRGIDWAIKPLYYFSSVNLVVTLVLTSMLLSGCTSSTPGIRKFYLLSLRYNSESKSSIIADLDGLLSKDRGENGTFSDIRIGYRGICIETRRDANASDADWTCGRRTTDLFTDLAGDPIDLLKVADLYKDRISFSTPLWAAALTLGIATLLVLVNCTPVPCIPVVTRKIASAAASLGMLLLLGCMVLQQVTSSAVEHLVAQLSVGAVDINVGNANIAFGWTAFACSVLAAIGTAAVLAVDVVILKAKICSASNLEKAIDERVTIDDFRQFSNSATPLPSAHKPVETDPRKKLAMKGVSLAGSILQNKFNARK